MVKRILEVMTDKYVKTIGKMTAEIMRKISGNSFKAEKKIDVKIDKFEEMVTEIDKISLAEIVKYAISLHFLES